MELDTINLILAFAVVLMSSLAIITLVFKFKNKSARAVFAQGALFSLWTIFLIWIRNGENTDLHLSQVMLITSSLAVFSFTVFSYYFPLIKKKNLNDRLAMISSSLLLVITVSLLFFPDLIIRSNDNIIFFTPGEFYNFYIFSIIFFFLLGFYHLITKYLFASNIYKTKLTYLLISNFILCSNLPIIQPSSKRSSSENLQTDLHINFFIL